MFMLENFKVQGIGVGIVYVVISVEIVMIVGLEWRDQLCCFVGMR